MRVLFLALVVALTATTTAHACKCVPPGSPAKEIKRADAAAFAKVVRRTVHGSGRYRFGSVKYRLKVLRDYKGNLGRRLTLRSNLSSAACGLDLRRGQRVGLLLYRSQGVLTSSSCSVRTRKHLDGGATASAAYCNRINQSRH